MPQLTTRRYRGDTLILETRTKSQPAVSASPI